MTTELFCIDLTQEAAAKTIADEFGFVLCNHAPPVDAGFYLCYQDDLLFLAQGDSPKTRVSVDFCGGKVAHRRHFGGGKGQDIAKAVGISSAYVPSVVDATAGLGRDSFVLATLGCDVIAVERQPVVAALLKDGLLRANIDDDVRPISERIHLVHDSSHRWLTEAPEKPVADVIYLDPMFDHDPKQKAAVKKDMQAFRSVVGQDADSDDLLGPALAAARCRVVVKRARKAEPLNGQAPSYSITGKSNRFDVYVLAKVAAAEK